MSDWELMTEAIQSAFTEAVEAERAYYDSSRSWTHEEAEKAKRRLDLAKWYLEDLGRKRGVMFKNGEVVTQ